ncbi:MAG: hypothetical protein KF768_13800 [Phycisphaeraceae bacterium]|nr:hypothetical protein [Phycisphaeraceae bacterium]
MRHWKLAVTGALALGAGASVGLAGVDVIFSRIAASPTSTVPGAEDLMGNPISPKFVSMLDFYLSPDGTKWLLRGASDAPTTHDAFLILGSGTTGSIVLQDGRPFPGAVGGELVDFFSGTNNRPFNANNDWAFTFRAKGGAASTFQKLIKFTSAGVGSIAHQMGDLYTGVLDTGTPGDEAIGNSFGSICLLDSGQVYWHDSTVQNVSPSLRPIVAVDAVKYLQVIVDSVTAIDGMTPITLTNVGSTGTLSVLNVSPDGSRVVIRGAVDVDGNNSNIPADPACVIVDGQVRVQVNTTVPVLGIVPTAINQAAVAPNNDWFVRGADSGGAFVIRNGAMLAKTGDSIGSGNWGSTMFSVQGNGNGDWVIAGKSDNVDPAFDDVLVVNGQVVLREGDPVQVPGHGTAYIGRAVVTNSAFAGTSQIGIAPDKTVYALVSLRSEAGGGVDLTPSGIPYALVRVTPGGGPCPGDFNDDGVVDLADLLDFLGTWNPNLGQSVTPGTNGDVNGDGVVDLGDLLDFLGDWNPNLGVTCP